MSKKKEMYAPLTRWQYFTKTLYHNAAAKTLFVCFPRDWWTGCSSPAPWRISAGSSP